MKTETKKDLEYMDNILANLEEDMDKSFMETGRSLAELYRAVCTAALVLPDMELTTDLMKVSNSEDGLTVVFDRRSLKHSNNHFDDPGYDEYEDDIDDDDEEGMLYDGD